MLGHQWQAIAFVGVIYRDDVDLGAQSRTSASHGGREAENGEATDDTNYSNVLGGPTRSYAGDWVTRSIRRRGEPTF